MKNILLLTDFSANAQHAIEYALALFKGGEHHFCLLNVHKTSSSVMTEMMASKASSSVYESLIKNPKKTLKVLTEKYAAQYKGERFSFEYICDYDAFTDAVGQLVKEKHIDLIVMGTNGATGAKEVVFGSNTINVIRHIDCSVLVVPEGYSFTGLKSVLFVTETAEAFKGDVLIPFNFIRARYHAALHILFIENEVLSLEESSRKEMKIKDHFKDQNPEYHSVTGLPADLALDAFVQLEQMDLIGKIINRKSFLQRLISGSSTPAITYKTRVPLLIMHS
ncbi:MAG: universal stress protein [Flavobacteriaceae bacterium]|nr:universal stress protein [Flavobacteriaceae bacterium]